MADVLRTYGNIIAEGEIACKDKISITSPNNYSYGTVGLSRYDGRTGATFGNGNGSDEIELNLQEANKITVKGGEFNVEGSISCEKSVSVTSSDNYSYGKVSLNRADGQTGAVLGEGNGDNEIELKLDKANKLIIDGYTDVNGALKCDYNLDVRGGSDFVYGKVNLMNKSGNLGAYLGSGTADEDIYLQLFDAKKLKLNGGELEVADSITCNKSISVTSNNNYSYGAVGLSRYDGQTGATIGNGNGNDQIDINLLKAGKLTVNGGALDVNGTVACNNKVSVTSSSNYSYGAIDLNRADGLVGATLGNGNGSNEIKLDLDTASKLVIDGGSIEVERNISHNGQNVPIIQTGTTVTLGYGTYGQVTSFPNPFPGTPTVILGNAAVLKPGSTTATGFDAKGRENTPEGLNVPYTAIYFPN